MLTPIAKLSVRRATAGDNVFLAEMGARTFREAYAADIVPEKLAAYVAGEFSPTEQARELAEPFFIASGILPRWARTPLSLPARRRQMC